MPAPPKLAQFLLKLMIPVENREPVLGDFAEEYERLYIQNTPRAARAWYWKQTYASLPHFGVSRILSSSLATILMTLVLGSFIFFVWQNLAFRLFRLIYTTNIFQGSVFWALFVRLSIELMGFVLVGLTARWCINTFQTRTKSNIIIRSLWPVWGLVFILALPSIFALLHELPAVQMRYHIARIVCVGPAVFFGAHLWRRSGD
jgi:hypothetical protein